MVYQTEPKVRRISLDKSKGIDGFRNKNSHLSYEISDSMPETINLNKHGETSSSVDIGLKGTSYHSGSATTNTTILATQSRMHHSTKDNIKKSKKLNKNQKATKSSSTKPTSKYKNV